MYISCVCTNILLDLYHLLIRTNLQSVLTILLNLIIAETSSTTGFRTLSTCATCTYMPLEKWTLSTLCSVSASSRGSWSRGSWRAGSILGKGLCFVSLFWCVLCLHSDCGIWNLPISPILPYHVDVLPYTYCLSFFLGLYFYVCSFPTIQGCVRRGMNVDALKNFIIGQGASRRVITMVSACFVYL